MNILKIKLLLAICFLSLFSISGRAEVEEIEEPASIDMELFRAIQAESMTQSRIDLSNFMTSSTPALSGIGSVIENFLPDFQISGLLGNDSGEPIVIDYSFPLSAQNLSNDVKLQLKINRGASISKDLSSALGADLATKLGEEIDDLDDIELMVSYNFSSERIGRYFEPNRTLFEQVTEGTYNDIFNSAEDDVRSAIKQLYSYPASIEDSNQKEQMQAISNAIDLAGDNETRIDCISLANQFPEPILADCQSYQTAILRRESVNEQFTVQYKPHMFAALVSNQPQFQVTASLRNRNELIGSDEFSLKVSYELGAVNLNTFRRFQRKNPAYSPQKSYQEYLTKFDPSKNDGRFKFSLEYSDVGDQKFNFENIAFLNKGGEKLTGSIGYGRSIMFDNDEAVMRVDANLEFEEYLNDTEGNDRVVGSITLTRKINQKLSIPFSIQYANKSEFISNDSNITTANLGFKYDFDWNE